MRNLCQSLHCGMRRAAANAQLPNATKSTANGNAGDGVNGTGQNACS